MKGMTIGVLAALAITGMADAAIIFFSDEIAFNQALADAGKTLKGIEDLDQALIPPFQSALLSDPLNINNLQGLFKPGDFIDNLAFQSNTNGTGSVNDPGVNGLNPRGRNGLMLIGPGFAGAPNTGLLVNLAVDSFDILSGPPAGDNHTALGMHVFTTLVVFPTEVRVFDKSEQEVGLISLPAVGIGGQFLGVLATGGDTIGRVNIWNAGGGGEGVYYVQAHWLPPPPPNNNPNNPQPINSGETISADFSDATSDGTSSCDPNSVDLFYEVTITTGPATLEVNTCGSVADTALAVFDSIMTELGCNTDCPGTPCAAPDACLTLPRLPADTYLIRVSQQTIAAASDSASSFMLSVLVQASTADLNGDGCTDSKDLTILLGAWCSAVNDPNPPSPPCENCTQANLDDADIAGTGGGPPDGCVDSNDLTVLLGDWCSDVGGNPCGTCGP